MNYLPYELKHFPIDHITHPLYDHCNYAWCPACFGDVDGLSILSLGPHKLYLSDCHKYSSLCYYTSLNCRSKSVYSILENDVDDELKTIVLYLTYAAVQMKPIMNDILAINPYIKGCLELFINEQKLNC